MSFEEGSCARGEALDIRVPGHRAQAARRFAPAADFLQGFNVHPAGHSVAVDVRGKPFTFGLWEGAVRQWGAPPTKPKSRKSVLP